MNVIATILCFIVSIVLGWEAIETENYFLFFPCALWIAAGFIWLSNCFRFYDE